MIQRPKVDPSPKRRTPQEVLALLNWLRDLRVPQIRKA